MKSRINYWALITFYTIAVLCRYITNKTGIMDGVSNEYLNALLRGIGPALGAIVVFVVFKIKPALSLKGNYKNVLIPALIYFILPIFLITVVEYFAKGTFIAIKAAFIILIYGMLEEYGWRGFLHKELKPLPPIVNIIIVSVLWFLWHLNFEISTGNLIFFGILLLGSWGIGKVADITGSLFAASAFHSLNNFFSDFTTARIMVLSVLFIVWLLFVIVKKRQLIKESSELTLESNK